MEGTSVRFESLNSFKNEKKGLELESLKVSASLGARTTRAVRELEAFNGNTEATMTGAARRASGQGPGWMPESFSDWTAWILVAPNRRELKGARNDG